MGDNMRFVACIVGLAVTGTALAQGADISQQDVQRAQAAMNMRITDTITKYANRLALDPSISSYCLQKLHLETINHPVNGHVPFGVNYNAIKLKKELDSILEARESFEIGYIKVCLAEARVALDAAERGRR
jgi:hypothetical protein